MTSISSTLSYTDVSVADSQGFAVISIGDVSFSVRALICNDPVFDGKTIDPEIVGYKPGCCLLHHSGGGMKSAPEAVRRFFPDDAPEAVARRIEAAVVEQNADIIRAVLAHPMRKGDFGAMYPAYVRKAFRETVLKHACSLDERYLNDMMCDWENANGAMPERLEQWASKWMSESGMSLADWVDLKYFVEIGKIDGMPVYFSRQHGIYGFTGHPEARHILELWLTSPAYPPGW